MKRWTDDEIVGLLIAVMEPLAAKQIPGRRNRIRCVSPIERLFNYGKRWSWARARRLFGRSDAWLWGFQSGWDDLEYGVRHDYSALLRNPLANARQRGYMDDFDAGLPVGDAVRAAIQGDA